MIGLPEPIAFVIASDRHKKKGNDKNKPMYILTAAILIKKKERGKERAGEEE